MKQLDWLNQSSTPAVSSDETAIVPLSAQKVRAQLKKVGFIPARMWRSGSYKAANGHPAKYIRWFPGYRVFIDEGIVKVRFQAETHDRREEESWVGQYQRKLKGIGVLCFVNGYREVVIDGLIVSPHKRDQPPTD